MQKMILCLFYVLFGVGALLAVDTNSYEQLTVEDAHKLADGKSGWLLLNGLKTISPEVAKELAQHKGWLSLNGLTTITDVDVLDGDGLSAACTELVESEGAFLVGIHHPC